MESVSEFGNGKRKPQGLSETKKATKKLVKPSFFKSNQWDEGTGRQNGVSVVLCH